MGSITLSLEKLKKECYVNSVHAMEKFHDTDLPTIWAIRYWTYCLVLSHKENFTFEDISLYSNSPSKIGCSFEK